MKPYSAIVRTTILLATAILLFVILVCISIPLSIRITEKKYMYVDLSKIPHTDIAIVLGASVVHGEPSPILKERAQTAVDLYKAKKVTKILVTGDNRALNYDEVTPVRTYLVAAGVSADDIVLDRAGFDTYSSLYRAQDVFHITSATIITQDFHLPRSLFIARYLGIDAYGFVAPGGEGLSYEYIREILATIKALFDISTGRKPEAISNLRSAFA